MSVVRDAMRTRERYGLSYGDAASIAAAWAMRCRTVLSEDLSNGQEYDDVIVVNPFV